MTTGTEALGPEQQGQGTRLSRKVIWTTIHTEARAAEGITKGVLRPRMAGVTQQSGGNRKTRALGKTRQLLNY